jgi:hypothetical protein
LYNAGKDIERTASDLRNQATSAKGGFYPFRIETNDGMKALISCFLGFHVYNYAA